MEKHVLIVTEKPDAAQKIAEYLDRIGKPQRVKEKGVPYYVARRDKKLIVVPAIGHLYTVSDPDSKRGRYPVFNFRWVPRHVAEKNSKHIQTWIEIFSKLAENAQEFINACDYDVEGSLIGYCILKYACGNKDGMAKRMKFSTMTKEELEKSYEEPLAHLDFASIEAGKTRHELDWLYGVNFSRALTLSAKRCSGKYATLSTGRVQGPTLKFLMMREREIRSFVPTPYWKITAEFEIGHSNYVAEYSRGRVKKKAEADAILKSCKGKTGEVKKVETETLCHMPPTPFNLGDLQAEAYSLFGYSPKMTENIAEGLYLGSLISYPRTSSQKLPPTINYKTILDGLSRDSTYENLASGLLKKTRLCPHEGRKEDPAHPAIYPTGNLPERSLNERERKVWDVIVRRFMAVFGEPSIRKHVRVSIDVDDYRFYLSGRQVVKDGWMQFYGPYKQTQEAILPALEEGDRSPLKRLTRVSKFTKAPPRFDAVRLIKKMENAGIGTKATRADIIETLYNRKYIFEKQIHVTDLGFSVAEILLKYCPEVVSVKLTREIEEKMNQIQSGKENGENLLLEATNQLKFVLERFTAKERIIGQFLSSAVETSRMQERVLGMCPFCGTGKLMILHSRKTRKRFIGCTSYFQGKCKASFPLPQKGKVQPAGKNCRACGWPLIRVWIKGRRPWMPCFNPNCQAKVNRT